MHRHIVFRSEHFRIVFAQPRGAQHAHADALTHHSCGVYEAHIARVIWTGGLATLSLVGRAALDGWEFGKYAARRHFAPQPFLRPGASIPIVHGSHSEIIEPTRGATKASRKSLHTFIWKPAMTSSGERSILGIRSRAAFETETEQSSAYYELSKKIDERVGKALMRTTISSWPDLVANIRHRDLARRMVMSVDWSWTLSTHLEPDVEYVPLYQLFLLCKFVANDFRPAPDTNRLQLSPSPMIDRLWHAHMLHPAKYMEMHTKLGYVDSDKLPRLLEHQSGAASDSYEKKTKRMTSLLGLMLYVCPSLYSQLQQPVTSLSDYSVVEAGPTQELSDSSTVTVKVVYLVNAVPYFFKMGPNTNLMRMVDHIASKIAIPPCELQLLYEGLRVSSSDTVTNLEIEDGDRFDLLPKLGGC